MFNIFVFFFPLLKDHFKMAGTTPCGLDRDICLKCRNAKLDENECNRQCNTVQEEKDRNGCMVQVNSLYTRTRKYERG